MPVKAKICAFLLGMLAMIGILIQKLFGPINNWPMGAAVSIILMLCIAGISLIFVLLTMFVRKRIS